MPLISFLAFMSFMSFMAFMALILFMRLPRPVARTRHESLRHRPGVRIRFASLERLVQTSRLSVLFNRFV